MFIELLIFVHTDGYFVFREGGGGGGCRQMEASGYSFPLFLVYPVDMPENKMDLARPQWYHLWQKMGFLVPDTDHDPPAASKRMSCLSLLERHGMIVADSQPQRWKLVEARDKVKVIGLFYSSFLPWPFLQHVSCVLCVYI